MVSERADEGEKFSKLFAFGKYEFEVLSDLTYIFDLVNVRVPDVIIFDLFSISVDFKGLLKKIRPLCENSALILNTDNTTADKELLKSANALINDGMNDDLILATISMNLRMKNSMERLSATNRDLADSLYRLNALYSTSSQFAGTLDKKKLINYMVEGIDKSLSFSLTSTLSFCTEDEPVLLINSLYDLSEEIIGALKLRAVLQYKSQYEGSNPPYEINSETLKVSKHIKYPANKFTFNLFQYDNMFASIKLGETLFGCVEIFKEAPFSAEDAKCFQTIAQQVILPLKSATLYQEIKETNLKLEKLERLKSEFISIVSHELRTPLTSIKNSLDILLSGKCGEINDAGNKFLDMAKRNVQRLSGIINDLLDLSKIEAGKMDFHFTKMNIHQVIDYVKNNLSLSAKGKGLVLSAEEAENLPDVNGDSQRLEQVLTNLVSNAIKFTPEGKHITIKSELKNAAEISVHPYFQDEISKLKGNYIVVSVIDEGIGIAEKDLLHAFDKFAQIENSLSRKVGGSGLGLPIAKQLLEAHKGAIWCNSQLEKGSDFCFAIPVAE